VELRYAGVTAANAAPIGVKVSDPRVTALEVAASDGTWRSGRIPLEAGAGVVRVPLLREGRNVFVLEGFPESGALRGGSRPDGSCHGVHQGAGRLT
jgi:hypothetical protein